MLTLYHRLISTPTIYLVFGFLVGIFIFRLALRLWHSVGKDGFDRTSKYGVKEYRDYNDMLKTETRNGLKQRLAELLAVLASGLMLCALITFLLKYDLV